MKIYLNRSPRSGPWGGGIKTVNKLVDHLSTRGHEVVFNLVEDIDVIFCIDPRPNEFGEWYQHFLNYRTTNKKTKIIQRVGDLGTHSKPELTNLIKQTLNLSDFFIFPSEWARDWIGFSGNNCEVIHNAPMSIFHENKRTSNISTVPKLITHHWSMNPKKGFHIYKQLDDYSKETGEFEFTYIGRLPETITLSRHLPPVGALELASELPEHDIYITASIEEAGANHVLEALAAGLPVVYHKDGGSINNYCNRFGKEFSSFEELLENLRDIISNYEKYKNEVLGYNVDNSDVVEKYIKIIEGI